MDPSASRLLQAVVLCGGFGGARMAHGFALLGDAVELTVIGNTADDLEVHGLHVSPDLDTVMYTLAGLANPDTGWGVRDETWSASEMFDRYDRPTWFRLGDRDLATHITRTERLRDGHRLTDVTSDLCRALGIDARLLPMSDDRVRTKLRTPDGWLDFQDYFVRRGHRDEVLDVQFEGLDSAAPTAEVLAAIESAGLIVIAPSNPFVSVAPILELPGVLPALLRGRAATIAVSPIIGGRALRGPAAAMLRSLGGRSAEAGVAGIAAHYARRYPGLVDLLALDRADAGEAHKVARHGIEPYVVDIVIAHEAQRRELAAELVRRSAAAVST